MIDVDIIRNWVHNLPDIYDQPPASSPTSKRKLTKHHPHQHLASPPASVVEMDLTPTRKRQKPDTFPPLDDLEVTPRPYAGSARSIASASTSTSGRRSHTSSNRSESPKKQVMSLRVDVKGVEFRQLDNRKLSERASDLLASLEEIGRGHDILPHDWSDTILRGSSSTRDARPWRYSFRPPGEPDQLPGRIPSFEEVEFIAEMAQECQNMGCDEAGWNGEVHQELLKSVFRGPRKRKDGTFNFAICNTARPHIKHLPPLAPAKMIDLCIYADLVEDKQWSQGLQNLSRITPTLTVNHTDFLPLQLRPIMFSIETKKPGTELDKAQLQMGVWNAAQWSFLRDAVSLALQSRKSSPPPASSSDQMSHNAQVDAALSLLGFIPGVIVQGHKWMFVLSTREGQKTILWTERQFGSTQSELEIYQVVAGLREMSAWSRDVYLPWFHQHVLPLVN